MRVRPLLKIHTHVLAKGEPTHFPTLCFRGLDNFSDSQKVWSYQIDWGFEDPASKGVWWACYVSQLTTHFGLVSVDSGNIVVGVLEEFVYSFPSRRFAQG